MLLKINDVYTQSSLNSMNNSFVSTRSSGTEAFYTPEGQDFSENSIDYSEADSVKTRRSLGSDFNEVKAEPEIGDKRVRESRSTASPGALAHFLSDVAKNAEISQVTKSSDKKRARRSSSIDSSNSIIKDETASPGEISALIEKSKNQTSNANVRRNTASPSALNSLLKEAMSENDNSFNTSNNSNKKEKSKSTPRHARRGTASPGALLDLLQG